MNGITGMYEVSGLPLEVSLPFSAVYQGYSYSNEIGPLNNAEQPLSLGVVDISIPIDTPTPEPTITPTPTPTPLPNLLIDPSFENGSVNKSIWVGSAQTNYKDNKILFDGNVSHDGNYSIYGLVPPAPSDNIYARIGQNITYGGNGFELKAWFYINQSEVPYYDNGTKSYKGSSLWAGVLDVPADKYNKSPNTMDNLTDTRAIGYNNRTSNNMFGYCVGYPASNPLRDLVSAPASGWYMGRIYYNGTAFTYEIYDSSGNLVGNTTVQETGFVPRAFIVNAGSYFSRIDDLYYTTW